MNQCSSSDTGNATGITYTFQITRKTQGGRVLLWRKYLQSLTMYLWPLFQKTLNDVVGVQVQEQQEAEILQTADIRLGPELKPRLVQAKQNHLIAA